MTSKTSEKVLVGLILVLILLSIILLAMKYIDWTLFKHQEGQTKPRPEQIIANYLREFPAKSEIREKAISILREYLGRSGVILHESFSVSAGSYRRVELKLHSDIIYELVVSVSGTCIGTCDIYLKLMDSKGNIAMLTTSTGSSTITGRYSYLRVNFTLHSFEKEGTFYLLLDNSYSIFTSKTVYITLKAYYPSYAFNDEYFEVFAIGHWVSTNLRYVNDPYGLEHIAPPNETLRVGAGDCDDFAVLLAVLYRSIGLNATVGLIDTDGDGKVDHVTALVYFKASPSEVLNSISEWASVIGVEVERISYFDADGGILLVVDPLMSIDKDNPWSIHHRPYKLLLTIKP